VENNSMIWIAGIVGLLAGIGIGSVLALWFTPAQQRSRDLAKLLQEKTDELRNYQQDVTRHFSETATLLGELANSYRDVHNHLAQGAQQLCPTQLGSRPILSRLPGSDEEERPAAAAAHVTPPLDYAPRQNPYEQGVLSEGFGLEKKPLPVTPAESATAGYTEPEKLG
jgi:uncharacterized membrane-anchored protein YhcB (DUF1043 family)